MVRIIFQNLSVGTVSKSSGIFSGSNVQWGYKQAGKQNQGFGSVSGRNCFVSDMDASLDDQDQSDTFSTGKPTDS